MGVSKFPKLRLPQLWGPTTLCVDLWLRWGLKQSCSLHWDPFNVMLYTTCMRGNWGDSQLLVIGSQIAILIPGLSFGHNLCFRCPNGSWEPILDIWIPIAFQWYKKNSIQWFLTPVITLCRFGSPLELQLPKCEILWECEGSFHHTFLHSREHEMWLLGVPLGPQPCKPFLWSRTQG
jgi:hypothetical protein